MKEKYQNIGRLMDNEIKEVVGCTEPASIAYAFSTALAELKKNTGKDINIKNIKASGKFSKDVFRNVSTVKIPAIKVKGAKAAAASGLMLKNSSLNMFRDFNRDSQEHAVRLINKNGWYKGGPLNREGLFVEAELSWGNDTVRVVIEDEHDFIKTINHNGKTIYRGKIRENNAGKLFGGGLKDIAAVALEAPQSLISRVKYFLNEQGKNVEKHQYSNCRDGVKDLTLRRMEGESIKIMTITGSGNQGIFLGVPLYMLYKREGDKFLPAVLFAILTQLYLAFEKGRISGICGLANKAALSLAAGLTYYREKGKKNRIKENMELVDETLRGMICEGAKKSCALKAVAAFVAVEEVAKGI
ncbi:MAG: L-serine ammonia-lyase, iron-sulfur-dependent, subunit alpha [Elusimicrobiota bacterium]|nr:L-serine ammonia-lyase, iron-sulfur-dependent, subunit alpha [Elusimicrobiota bacterium]